MSFLRGLIAVVMGLLAVREAGLVRDDLDRVLDTKFSLEGWALVLVPLLMLSAGVWLMLRGRRAADLIVWASGVTLVLTFYLTATLDPELYDTPLADRVGMHLVVLMTAGALVLCAGALELRVRRRDHQPSDPEPNLESSAESSF